MIDFDLFGDFNKSEFLWTFRKSDTQQNIDRTNIKFDCKKLKCGNNYDIALKVD